MNYRELFQSVRRRPILHGLDATYKAGVAFILGCDAGTSGILLSGFREWLIVRLNDGNNLSWPGLVLQIISVEFVGQNEEQSDVEAQRFDRLFRLLDEFLEQRDERDGMARIYSHYIEWLNDQSWFCPEMLK
ncbi:hypothetical protein GCM10023196_033110 [Actinoallomurus vinaceus]|uniref:Uncharacterized protein n=1 Tax=Actinoallomurus vinaceus TaxID=1080074 RepID=A0ABP8UBX2_9ACTN